MSLRNNSFVKLKVWYVLLYFQEYKDKVKKFLKVIGIIVIRFSEEKRLPGLLYIDDLVLSNLKVQGNKSDKTKVTVLEGEKRIIM